MSGPLLESRGRPQSLAPTLPATEQPTICVIYTNSCNTHTQGPPSSQPCICLHPPHTMFVIQNPYAHPLRNPHQPALTHTPVAPLRHPPTPQHSAPPPPPYPAAPSPRDPPCRLVPSPSVLPPPELTAAPCAGQPAHPHPPCPAHLVAPCRCRTLGAAHPATHGTGLFTHRITHPRHHHPLHTRPMPAAPVSPSINTHSPQQSFAG